MPGSCLTILHLAPHPDDESIGAPATLLELQAAGHHVINYPCSFGRAEQVDTRRAELEEACRRAGFELDRAARGFSISGGDDLAAAQRGLTKEVGDRIAARQVDILVAPSAHDGHHGHELVGRAARDAVETCGDAPRLWLWGLWADLPCRRSTSASTRPPSTRSSPCWRRIRASSRATTTANWSAAARGPIASSVRSGSSGTAARREGRT